MSIHHWHRRIGLLSAVFVLVLSVSGLLLMFSEPLGLRHKQLAGRGIDLIYGQQNIRLVARLGDAYFVWSDGQLYKRSSHHSSIAFSTPPDRLFVDVQGDIHVQSSQESAIFMPSGRLIEKNPTQRLTELDESGQFAYFEPDKSEYDSSPSVVLEKVILDVHSGRFLGPVGQYIMAGTALFLIFLSISGLYMWSGLARFIHSKPDDCDPSQ